MFRSKEERKREGPAERVGIHISTTRIDLEEEIPVARVDPGAPGTLGEKLEEESGRSKTPKG